MKPIFRILSAALLGLTVPYPSKADDPYFIQISGSGVYSFGPSVSEHISSVTFSLAQGYAMYSFRAGELMISLEASSDFQPSPSVYSIKVGKVSNYSAKGPGSTIPAEGICVQKSDDTAMYVHEITCTAETELGKISLQFAGDGTPVQIERITPEDLAARAKLKKAQ